MKYKFNKNDFNSNDGMLTSVWGPSMCHSLHTISFNYPINPDNKTKKQYLNFFMSLQHILPCRYCREICKKNIKSVPLNKTTMKNRDTLSKWLYNLHEEINRLLNKKSNLTYDDVRSRYELFRSRCLATKNSKSNIKNKSKNKAKTKKGRKVKELGCVKPLYGIKSKCIINIVPKNKKCKTFNIDKQCIIRQ
jgi:hypothetical protein